MGKAWWRWEELNLRHGAYETPALPLSYTAVGSTMGGKRGGRFYRTGCRPARKRARPFHWRRARDGAELRWRAEDGFARAAMRASRSGTRRACHSDDAWDRREDRERLRALRYVRADDRADVVGFSLSHGYGPRSVYD
jgi:hypothetical protein